MLLAHEQGATGVVVVNNRVSVGSVVKMNLGELTHRLDFKKIIGQSLKSLENKYLVLTEIRSQKVSFNKFSSLKIT